MKLTVLQAALLLQRKARGFQSAQLFGLVKQIIRRLRECDQNYLMKALGFSAFQHEPLEVIFKLRGETFPPAVLYSVRLVNAVHMRHRVDGFAVPRYVETQQPPHVFRPLRFRSLVEPVSQSTAQVFGRVSVYDLAGVTEISSRRQAPVRRKTYRERQAERLRRMLGLDKFEQSIQAQNDYFIASQASDLNEFVKLLDQPHLDDHEQNALIDAYFGAEEERNDISHILDMLPESQFPQFQLAPRESL